MIHNITLPKKQFTEELIRETATRWKNDGYPDSPYARGCVSTFKRLYEGQYDEKFARKIIFDVFGEHDSELSEI